MSGSFRGTWQIGLCFCFFFFVLFFFFNVTATTEIYTLSLHDALPILSGARLIDWDDPAAAIAAFLTIIMMPLTYSIAEGLAMGLIAYPLVKAFQGKVNETTLGMWILAAIFILRYVFIAGG